MKVSTEPSLGERLCLVLWSMLRCLCKNELHFSKVLMGGVFTQNPDLWITLLGIHSLTYNRTSCFSMAHGWSWGIWLGLVTSSQFGPSLIGHCIWEVFYAKSLEFIMLSYFLCWILYFFLKNYYPITTPWRTFYSKICLMDLQIGEDIFFLIFSIQHPIVLWSVYVSKVDIILSFSSYQLKCMSVAFIIYKATSELYLPQRVGQFSMHKLYIQ